jgi:replication factor C subunit 1
MNRLTKSAIEEVIERMDEYFLSKDEWDTLVELGVGSHKDELVLKKVSTATKSSFTRKYVVVVIPVCR